MTLFFLRWQTTYSKCSAVDVVSTLLQKHNLWICLCENAETIRHPSKPRIICIMSFLSLLTLICWLSPCAERLASSLITDCLYVFCLWTPLQQTSSPFNQHCVSIMLVLFTVFIAHVYANGFLLCCGSAPDCFMIGPNDQRWLTITAKTESWCTCLPQSQWAGVLQCLCQTLPSAGKGLRFKFGQTCPSRRISFPPLDHCCVWDVVISGSGSCSRCISGS